MKLTCKIFTYTKQLSFFLVMFLLTSSFYAQTTWEKQYPQTSAWLSDIYSFDLNTAITCGSGGDILKTVDGGATWYRVVSGTANNLKDVFFIGGNGWIVGENIILYSSNYGDTWAVQLNANGTTFSQVDFVSINNGWAAASFGKIYRTTDGGSNWTAVQTTSTNWFFAVDFVNSLVGYAAGANSVYATTTDGGVTWSVTEGLTGVAQTYKDIKFYDSNNGIRVGIPQGDSTPTIQRTTDGGVNWNAIVNVPATINIHTNTFHRISWVSNTIAYIAGNNGKILKTINGGNAWVEQASGDKFIYSVDAVYDDLAYAVGYGGFILKTTDGINWSNLITQNTTYELTGVFFIDENKGWATTNSYDGTLLKTTDGGANWSSINLNTTFPLHDVYFSSPDVGYVVGEEGKVFYTDDGGNNWAEQGTGNLDRLSCVEFLNDNIGYVAGSLWGEGGTPHRVYRTTSRGNTWEYSNFAEEINDIAILDVKTVIVVGSGRSIYKSTDYGRWSTWVKKTTNLVDPFDGINGVHFVNKTIGYACSGLGFVLKTTDGGENWLSVYGVPNISLNDIFFVDSQNGWAVGSEGTLIETTDGGTTWAIKTKLTNGNLNAIHFPNGKNGWVVGEYGTVLKATRNLSNNKPAPVTNVFPPDGDFDVEDLTALKWGIGLGADPTGYKLYFGTDGGGTTPPTNIENGTTITPKEVVNYLTSSLLLNTTYYWQIIPYNTNGDAPNCPIWSFKTRESLYFGGGGTTCPDYFFANSLPGASGAPSNPTYSWIDPVANMHTRVNQVTSGDWDDGYYGPVNIGFDFPFFGTDQTELYISTNGVVTFGAGYLGKGTNASIPHSDEPNNMIAVLLMDLYEATGNYLYYKSSATECIITWDGFWVEVTGAPDVYITFQVIIKPSGYIQFQYNSDESSFPLPAVIGDDALIGIEDAFGYSGAEYRNNGVGGPIFGSPNALSFGNENAPVPVELTSFTAGLQLRSATEQDVVLNWTTATEVNNYGFEIERQNQESSIKNQDKNQSWETIGFVEGHGNSNSPKEYRFVDTSTPLSASTVSYRLKQIDIDGAFEYSDLVEVSIAGKVEFKLLQNHPNPFNPSTIISFSIPKAGVVKLNVYNILGEVVAELVNENLVAGFHQYQFDASNLTSGIYFYSISASGFREVKKMNLIR